MFINGTALFVSVSVDILVVIVFYNIDKESNSGLFLHCSVQVYELIALFVRRSCFSGFNVVNLKKTAEMSVARKKNISTFNLLVVNTVPAKIIGMRGKAEV